MRLSLLLLSLLALASAAPPHYKKWKHEHKGGKVLAAYETQPGGGQRSAIGIDDNAPDSSDGDDSHKWSQWKTSKPWKSPNSGDMDQDIKTDAETDPSVEPLQDTDNSDSWQKPDDSAGQEPADSNSWQEEEDGDEDTEEDTDGDDGKVEGKSGWEKAAGSCWEKKKEIKDHLHFFQKSLKECTKENDGLKKMESMSGSLPDLWAENKALKKQISDMQNEQGSKGFKDVLDENVKLQEELNQLKQVYEKKLKDNVKRERDRCRRGSISAASNPK